MTTTSERPVPASSPDLPPVERRAAIPPGFRAGGLAAGIKASGRPDLAVVVTTSGPAAAAAVFTPNTFAAAPVRLSKAHLAATSGDARGGFGWAEAIISTSGSANAATGAAGDADQAEIAEMLAAATGVPVERTLHLSTGIIGTRLPLKTVRAGLGVPDARRWPMATPGCWPPRRRCGPPIRSSRSRRRRSSCRTMPGARSGSPSAGSPRASG